ncbi:MAG TPA: neutral/alkaline non-lysosomal ceramidase N-terminal domain-containing protein [Bryobacteraceae bacterium]|nr:neutral/alkaline non-lysosomal ceramidase N-terminal domain-containing protein [Bryobacteraceae bacterium]
MIPSALLLLFSGAAAAGPFRAGAHAVDISPLTAPIVTSGQFLPVLAERTLDPLRARSLALDDGQQRVVLTVVDTLMMPRELLDRVKAAAARSTGIPERNMMISATHTHSAPAVMGALGTDVNPEYVRLFEAGLIKAIEGAVSRLAPARAGWTVVQDFEHTHNRRWILRPDRLRQDPFGDWNVRANMHPGYQNPDFLGPSGPVDPDLTLLAIQSASGRPIALLANYSMHYVGRFGRVVSSDYYGHFAESLQRSIGAQDGSQPFIAMMSQGTSGDQMWMDYSQPEKKVEYKAYAGELAAIAREAFKKIRFKDGITLACAETTLRLSRRVASPERLAWAKEVMSGMAGGPPRNQYEVYAREQRLIAAEPERELKLQAFRIGEIGIAAIPNEVYAISGLKIKIQSPLQPTFNIELANGAEGYIPPPEQHRLGGYTTWAARTAALETGAEPKIVDAVLQLLEAVAGKSRRPVEHGNGKYARTMLAGKPLAYWRCNEISGPAARDATGNRLEVLYEGGVAFYLEGPGPGFSAGEANRAPHFAGGRMRADLTGLHDSYSVELWFQNLLPTDARPVTGHLLSLSKDRIAIGGTERAAGKLLVFSGDRVFEGVTPVAPKSWNHLVFVRDGSGFRVFLNSRTEIAGVSTSQSPARQLTIASAEGDRSTFEGKIDEVSIYPRALQAAEVYAHFTAAGAR